MLRIVATALAACVCQQAGLAQDRGAAEAFREVAEFDNTISEQAEALRDRAAKLVAQGLTREATALRGQADEQEASIIRRYEEFLAEHPEHVDARVALGLLYTQLRRPGDAAQQYREAIRLDPKNAEAHNGLGVYYSHHGTSLQTLQAFRRAVELDPGQAVYHFNLGTLYYTARRVAAKAYGWDLPRAFAESQKELESASSLEPDNSEYATAGALNYYGAVHFGIENPWRAAKAAWLKLLEPQLSGEPRAHVLTHLGRVCLRLDDKVSARQYLIEARALSQSHVVEHLLKQCWDQLP